MSGVKYFYKLYTWNAQNNQDSFYQKVQTNIPLPPVAGKNIIRLSPSDSTIIAVSNTIHFPVSPGEPIFLSSVPGKP